ncbi:divergent polysaccharide deacetylase family protein [Peribacillus sp. JNUCC 23]
MIKLPVKLTVAIISFMPSTKEDAELASQYGHDVIVHLPMESIKGKKSWLDPGAITTDLSNKEIRKRVETAVKDIPHAVGRIHHMGSKVTQDERVMKIVLEVCKENGLFYLDSKTTEKNVVSKLLTK